MSTYDLQTIVCGAICAAVLIAWVIRRHRAKGRLCNWQDRGPGTGWRAGK